MDNTQNNKSIDANATRKRRSSILKSQRPPRTPFSEVEFKVATPTDTVKSRRVSFSRLTGVAEFVTNEGTTTWKNFYEEHNKSLESSGNESAANARKPMTIGHIGRSIFDQQFEEVEVVDIDGNIVPSNPNQELQISNNTNFTQNLAELECTGDDRKLTLPQQNFELSALTDHQSKLFGDDLTVPGITEMSSQLKINFSTMQPLEGKLDDLDEIQNDLKRAQQNVICSGPVFGNISEYIEVDLNMTHVGLKDDVCDMSITDTICSPKVQDIPKKQPKKSIVEFNVEDKENLVLNPYAPLREADNFAVNSEVDKVLVFDGKRLTVQTERKSNVQDKATNVQTRKTIVLNTNDDLPNFISPSDPQDVPANAEKVPRRKTIVFEDEECNISITQAIPAKVIVSEKRKTIVYENDTGNISMTQGVPTNIICNDVQRTMYDDNLSFTQAIPAVIQKQDRTLHFENNDISMTQALPQNIIKRRTICNEVDISMTQAVPTNILIDKQNDGKTVIFDNDMDVSMTQAVPQNILLPEIAQKTIVYDDNGELSMTEAIPAKAILPILENALVAACDKVTLDKDYQEFTQVKSQDISMTQVLPSNIILTKCDTSKSVLYGDANMSTTKVLPDNILINNMTDDTLIKDNIILDHEDEKVLDHKETDDDRTSPVDNKCEVGNLTLTKPIPSNILSLHTDMEKTLENKHLLNIEKSMSEKREILVYQVTDDNVIKTERDDIENLQTDTKDSDISLNMDDPDKKPSVINMAELKSSQIKEEKQDLIENKLAGVTKSVSQNSLNAKKSILNELLDMSAASSAYNLDDKNVTADLEIPPNPAANNEDEKSDNSSNDSVFIIRKDSNDDKLIKEILEENKEMVTIPQIENKLPALEYKEDILDDLNNKLVALKSSSTNRHVEMISTGVKTEEKISTESVSRKSIKTADDTRELLQMLSEFTDRRSLPTIMDETETESDDKDSKTQTEKRISFAPKSRLTLSREDLLNNISMAQAGLQQSRFDIDSDSVEETDDSPNEIVRVENTRRKSSLRISNDVVKALQFDDSVSETNVESPLKKTAFGETSYMKEKPKAKVIPTYDVSDGIKELMSDLVKPMADVLPFESGNLDKTTKKSPSTISTQIQANLITSSQIDLDVELQSNPESVAEIKKDLTLMDEIARLGSRAVSSILKRSEPSMSMDMSMEEVRIEDVKAPSDEKGTPRRYQSIPGPVLYFDQENPLNNVLISPMDYENAHPYDPIKSNETLMPEKRSVQFSDTSSRNKIDEERVSTQYNVVQILPAGDACTEKNDKQKAAKPISIDNCTEGTTMELKDTQINTEIAMKKNNELLEANSSLTLVDDALARSVFDVDLDTTQSEDTSSQKSALRVIYKMDNNGVLSEKIESNDVIDLTSNEEFYEDIQTAKTRKRSYSPTRDRNKISVEITPKPVSKMQKISNSPNSKTENEKKNKSPEKKVEKRSPKKKNSPRRKPSVTIQQLLTEYNIVDIDHKAIAQEVDHALQSVLSLDMDLKESVEAVTSYADDFVEEEGTESGQDGKLDSDVSRIDWQKESLSEQSSKNYLEDCDSSANVVAKINMLPFMGSRDCEWESRAGDTWSFLVLRARVRLSACLAHSHLNASRSRVRADTPVLSVNVEPVKDDEKDPLISLGVRLAADAMRYEWSRGCVTAGAIPSALRRCASVARLALQWLRAVRDAAARLALHVAADGGLTVKVANVPLRSVWELTMKVELVVEDGQLWAWPRAGAIGITAIIADEVVPLDTLRHLVETVPHDWGHVPRTIWKLFRYLKNKMREEDLCGLTIMNTIRCK